MPSFKRENPSSLASPSVLKGLEYWKSRGYNVVSFHERLPDQISHELFSEVIIDAIRRFEAGECDKAMVAYNNFVSTFKIEPMIRQVLPFKLDEVKAIIEGITPLKGKYAEDVIKLTPVHSDISYLSEPDEETVYKVLLPKLLGAFLYHAGLESKASEFSARMVAMKSASDKALELSQSFTRTYNKIRQSSITREVSEIIGGMEALSK